MLPCPRYTEPALVPMCEAVRRIFAAGAADQAAVGAKRRRLGEGPTAGGASAAKVNFTGLAQNLGQL